MFWKPTCCKSNTFKAKENTYEIVHRNPITKCFTAWQLSIYMPGQVAKQGYGFFYMWWAWLRILSPKSPAAEISWWRERCLVETNIICCHSAARAFLVIEISSVKPNCSYTIFRNFYKSVAISEQIWSMSANIVDEGRLLPDIIPMLMGLMCTMPSFVYTYADSKWPFTAL